MIRCRLGLHAWTQPRARYFERQGWRMIITCTRCRTTRLAR